MACFWSHTFGKVGEDGFQYCQHCGFAAMPKCSHDWETIKETTITKRKENEYNFGFHEVKIADLYVLRCKRCGEIAYRKIYLN